MDASLYRRAREFAEEMHGNQRYGLEPYTVHLEAVIQTLQAFGYQDDDTMLAAGWCHDVLEDTRCTREELADATSAEVASLVWAVTTPNGGAVHSGRKGRVAALNEHLLRNASRAACTLKIADRIANVEACLGIVGIGNQTYECWRNTNSKLLFMYVNEHLEFTAVVSPRGDGQMMKYLDTLIMLARQRLSVMHQ